MKKLLFILFLAACTAYAVTYSKKISAKKAATQSVAAAEAAATPIPIATPEPLAPEAAPFPIARGFTPLRNVNTDKPVEKIILFEKGKPADALDFEYSENAKTGIQNGCIESHITGNSGVKIVIRWKEQANYRAIIDASRFRYFLITCRFEGANYTKKPDGSKVNPIRRDNLWVGPMFFNSQGKGIAGGNFADVNDGKTPSNMFAMRFPMAVFSFYGADLSDINGIGLVWDSTRAEVERDYRWVIERISFAD